MPIAAVPDYLGTDFQHASPGMRFGMYLKFWEGTSWEKVKNRLLDDTKRLNDNDKKTMHALLSRQQQAFDAVATASNTLRLDALATAPFTTGLGNEHPLENGFAFLNPYGLPYLPGSGVKGVLRQAARELASGDWGDAHGWSEGKLYTLLQGEGEKRKPVMDKHKQPVMLTMLDILLGRESANGDTDHLRGALTFWDVIPQIKGDHLVVEIMTPHLSHYYQPKKDQRGNEIVVPPHESGQPIPISFLSVPPGSGFVFHAQCDLAHLARLAPELAQNGHWKTLLEAAFKHAFEWLGFGAKTAVGYGAMRRDDAAEAQREEDTRSKLAEDERQARRKQSSGRMLQVEDYVEYMQKRFEALRGMPTRVTNSDELNRTRNLARVALEGADWTPEEKRAVAEAITEWLPKVVEDTRRDRFKEQFKKLKLAALRDAI